MRNILIENGKTRDLQNWQAHHLIPVAEIFKLPRNVQAAIAKEGWRLDSPENLVAVPADEKTYFGAPNRTFMPMHRGSHPVYSREVEARLKPVLGMQNVLPIMRGIERTMLGRLIDKSAGYHTRVR